MKRILSSIGIFVLIFGGLALLVYLPVSHVWNERHATHVVENYATQVKDNTRVQNAALLAAAEQYNEQLAALQDPLAEYDQVAGYDDLLNLDGTGMMGYIQINRIDQKLPIYHGVSDSVLAFAVGHMEGTSLPVGGAGTHAVLSAHRGLPSAKLFTDLNQMQIGDQFTITMLDREMVYQVDDIRTVLPEETDVLRTNDGGDYVTLSTCTPYGINTHRLLVRGRRVEETNKGLQLPAEGSLFDTRKVTGVLLAVLFVVFLGIYLLVRRVIRKRDT